MHVLVVSDAPDAAVTGEPGGSPGPVVPGSPGGTAAFSHRLAMPSADRELVDALERSGVEVSHATWTALAHGTVPLDGVDLVHLRPAALRHGPRSGDRRVGGLPARLGLPWRLDRRRSGRPDRRSATGILRNLPAGLPVVLTLPTRPPVPAAVTGSDAGQLVHRPGRVAAGTGAPGSRPVHVIAADSAAASGLESVLPGTHAASVAEIGRGFAEPSHVRPYRVPGPVVLVITTAGEPREAVTALRAAESVGRTGLRFTVVVAGSGPTVRGVPRATALAESTGVRVRFLGRATSGELARWRATASVCIASSAEEGADADVADMLLSGVPVLALRTPVHAALAAQARVLPAWYVAGDVSGLSILLERWLTALPQVPVQLDAAAVAIGGGSLPAGSASGASSSIAVRASTAPADAVVEPPASRVLPNWDDIARQTTWVYQKALQAVHG